MQFLSGAFATVAVVVAEALSIVLHEVVLTLESADGIAIVSPDGVRQYISRLPDDIQHSTRR